MKSSYRTLSKLVLPAILLTIAGLAAPAIADSGNGHKNGVIYSSTVTPLPGNLPSVGGEAYAFNEFGNSVTFSPGSNRNLSKVVVTMSSWGCASGSWFAHNCQTPEDASFSLPITLNIYNPSSDGVHPGSRIATVTETFEIPYRPSASTQCTGGRWYQESSKRCYNGLATNITFKLDHVTVPDSAIFGITYNTSHYGYAPIGQSAACYSTTAGCGYDSLNIALSEDPTNVTIGTNTNPGKVWQNSPFGSQYCDNGAAGVGSFRLDSPGTPSCWGTGDATAAPYYVPAIRVYAGNGEGDSESQAGNSDGQGNGGNKSEGDHKVSKS